MTNNLVIRLGDEACIGWLRQPREPLPRFAGLQKGGVLRRWVGPRRSGWWIVPAAAGGALVWGGIAARMMGVI